MLEVDIILNFILYVVIILDSGRFKCIQTTIVSCDFESTLFGGLALSTTENTGEGFTIATNQMQSLTGSKGVAYTILRPAGKIIVDDRIYDAVAQFGYIEKGSSVEVVECENGSVIVKKIEK